MARPCKLSPETQSKLIRAIKTGCPFVTACDYANLDYSTFRRWLLKGQKQSTGRFREFCDAVRSAESGLEVKLIATWHQSAETDWRAAAEFLSRRFPDRWSPTQKFQVQLEAELNAIYDRIENDPTIPLEYKKIIFTVLSSSGESKNSS